MRRTIAFVIATVLFSLSLLPVGATEYRVNTSKSKVTFSLKHLKVQTVKGNFSSFSGSVHYNDASPKNSSAQGSIKTSTINTGINTRDDHLKEVFEVNNFPKITFNTTGVKVLEEGKHYTVSGNLTIKGTTKLVNIDVQVKSSSDNEVRFVGTTTINRKDFGIKWNSLKDSAVDEKVYVYLDIVADKAV